KFKAKALQEKVYIEYDKVKADTWDRRNMRVEFNPNKLTHDEIGYMEHYSHYGSAYFIHEDVNQKLIDSVYETISSYSNTFD
ncbi:urease accessory protein UreD, partial [Staphylococcus aureus]|nr:urease accessory protein UreD [Staphylococcus aureus]